MKLNGSRIIVSRYTSVIDAAHSTVCRKMRQASDGMSLRWAMYHRKRQHHQEEDKLGHVQFLMVCAEMIESLKTVNSYCSFFSKELGRIWTAIQVYCQHQY
jgi:hypothetical protein